MTPGTPASAASADVAVFAASLSEGEAVAWIPGWEGRYAATDRGRILSVSRSTVKELAGDYPDKGGRRAVTFREKAGRGKLHTPVGKLVLASFDPRPGAFDPKFPLVARHKDGNETNDMLSNLEWGDKKENRDDRSYHEYVESLAEDGWCAVDIAQAVGRDEAQIFAILARRARPAPPPTVWSLVDIPVPLGEAFRWVPGWEGEYAVSDHARVFSFKGRRPTQLSPVVARGNRGDERFVFTFSRVSELKTIRRAHLVAAAFLGPRPSPEAVLRHLNDSAFDDRPANLAWGSQAENVADMMENGHGRAGETHPTAKLTDVQVAEIRARYAAGRAGEGPRETVKTLAAAFGVSPGQIHNIVSGKQRNAGGRTADGPGTGRGSTHYRATIDEGLVRRIKQAARTIRDAGGHPTPAKVRDRLDAADRERTALHAIKGIINGRSWRHVILEEGE